MARAGEERGTDDKKLAMKVTTEFNDGKKMGGGRRTASLSERRCRGTQKMRGGWSV